MRLSVLRNKISFLFAGLFLLAMVSCSEDKATIPDDSYSGEDNIIGISFTMKAASITRGETPLPAEQIRTLRVVVVDLGYSHEGEYVEEPSVEYNQLVSAEAINQGSASDDATGQNNDLVEVIIPRVKADRMKKMYLIVNAEPATHASLDIRLANGDKIDGYGDESLFLPQDGFDPENSTSPIDNAVFVAPQGSYINNNLGDNEELLAPMTAIHNFTVPTFAEIVAKYPTLNTKPTYPMPGDILVVRAINKIWFEFVNATYQNKDHYQPLDLLITEWSLSDVNDGDSYLFGKPGDSDNYFTYYEKTEDNINEPWMQWIYDEALRSQEGTIYQWLTDYRMPAGAKKSLMTFSPENYAGGEEDVPQDKDGIFIPAPSTTAGTSTSTEALPVYFGESHSGNPQKYEMGFTVWQRAAGSNSEWSNPYTYKVVSSTDPGDQDTFHLLSLFRNTDVVMEVTFISGRSAVEMEVELHPYGSVVLNPEFGL